MYYFDGHQTNIKAKTIKELKKEIEKTDCLAGEIYRGNQLYALAKKEKNYNVACGSWCSWTYKTCK